MNSHAVLLTSWIANVSAKATELMRPNYGQSYEFEASTPRNAEMVAMAMYSYR